MVNSAGVTQSLVDQVEALTSYAIGLWSNALAGNATANVQVSIVEGTSSGRAQGGNGTSGFLGTFDGRDVFEPGVAYELRTGKELGRPDEDIHIDIEKAYLLNQLFLDSTPETANDIPLLRVDALSVLVHEVGHGLGFIGYYDEADDTFDFGANTPYDTRIRQISGETYFEGPNVTAVFGGDLPLTDNNYTHYGNTSANPVGSSDPLTGLMNGVAYYTGYRYTISSLDLAVMADLGLGTIRNDIFDLPYQHDFNGGAGIDTVDYGRSAAAVNVSLAIAGPQNIGGGVTGTLVSIENLSGSPFADNLTGSGANNVLSGGAGNDILTGGGGNDQIDGGGGNDIAYYSGNRSQYAVTRQADGYRIRDTRAGGNDGEDFVKGIETFHFAGGNVAAQDLTLTLPAADQWILYTGNGFKADVGGSGQVIGTNAFQDINVLDRPGAIIFDGSFNRGGDLVRLPGNASAWKVATSGNGVIFSDGDTFAYVPVGTDGLAVRFTDGVRSLRYDEAAGTVKIGSQAVGDAPISITAPVDGTLIPTGADPESRGTLYLAVNGEVVAGGRLDITGTALGHETVELTAGSAVLDGSFNKGGDTLVLNQNESSSTGHVSGSRFEIQTGGGPNVSIPVGEEGMDIVFENHHRLLIYDPETLQLLLGTQHIPLSGTVDLGPGF
jgi:hypothetical protein